MDNFITGFVVGFVFTAAALIAMAWPKKPKRQRRERSEGV